MGIPCERVLHPTPNPPLVIVRSPWGRNGATRALQGTGTPTRRTASVNLRPRQETDFTATTAQMLGDGQHHVVDPLGVPARALRGAEYMPHKGFEHRFIGS